MPPTRWSPPGAGALRSSGRCSWPPIFAWIFRKILRIPSRPLYFHFRRAADTGCFSVKIPKKTQLICRNFLGYQVPRPLPPVFHKNFFLKTPDYSRYRGFSTHREMLELCQVCDAAIILRISVFFQDPGPQRCKNNDGPGSSAVFLLSNHVSTGPGVLSGPRDGAPRRRASGARVTAWFLF